MNLKGCNVLCTGGAGFIGLNTVQALLSLGANVLLMDNFSRSVATLSQGTKHLHEVKNLKILNGDVTKRRDVHYAMGHKINVIIHLAALIDVPESMKKQFDYYQTNVVGTDLLMEEATKSCVNRFIFASSCAVYGDKTHKVTEQDSINPQSFYAATKAIGEDIIINEGRRHEALCTIVLRYFNVYGKLQRPLHGGVVSKFVDAVLNHEPVIIHGDGSQVRNFVYIRDVVNANLLAIQNGRSGGIYNIGNNVCTIEELYKTIRMMFNKSHKRVKHAKERPGDIHGFDCNWGEATHELGYAPRFNLMQGLQEILAWRTNSVKGGKL